VEGWRATSPRAVEKVERSSCANFWLLVSILLCFEIESETGCNGERERERMEVIERNGCRSHVTEMSCSGVR